MRQMTKVAMALGLSAATLSASGWRIPENSLNSVALSAAYVASANGADASYFNPANMAFMDEGSSLEMALTYINLPEIKYTDAANAGYNTDSKVEHFVAPSFHYVSEKHGDFRYGFSMVAPGGLSKRWDETYSKTSAEEFSLTIVEFNPNMSYKVTNDFALGLGARMVYVDGVVKSSGVAPADLDASGGAPESLVNITRDMEGDSFDFGYNLALSYKATDKLRLATTYRSKVDLTVEGTASLTSTVLAGGIANGATASYNGGTSVTIPLPASLTLAASYDFDKTTVEFVFERTYWSAYKNLDFEYDSAFTNSGGLAGALAEAVMSAAFDDAKAKNWEDANAYRLGVTHKYSDDLTLMAGYAYDEAGAVESTLGFELPDTDAQLFSFGFDYKWSKDINVGFAYLYDKKESVTVNHRTVTNPGGLNGTFKGASAHLATVSFKYKF